MTNQNKNLEPATLAGGCFWGVEQLFAQEKGVVETRVGYMGGTVKNASYTDVKSGETGHAECVQVIFDTTLTSFENILTFFFRMHNPTTPNRQGNDLGSQYRSAIFFHTPEQEKTAQKVIEQVNKLGHWKAPVVTEVVPASDFWEAEAYHQKYLQKNPRGYTCHFVRNFEKNEL
jgi:methionine-S-sulfoxide reductase